MSGAINNPALNGLGSMTGAAFFSSLVSVLITLAFVIGIIVFVFMLITGGVQWINSGGDKAALEAAKGKLTHAAIGLVILLAIFAFIQAIQTMFGINLLNITVPTIQ